MKKYFYLLIISAFLLLISCTPKPQPDPKPGITKYRLTVTASSSEFGTVTGSGDYPENTSVYITAEASNGSYFLNWTEDSTIYSTQTSLKFIMPAENTVITANFGTYTYEFESGNGTEEKPYVIKNDYQLKLMEKFNNTYFILSDDISLSSTWTAIGKIASSDNPVYFSNHFDGKNHHIYNLKINDNSMFSGLISYISTGSVKNLNIEIKNSESDNMHLGAVSGWNRGLIENVNVISSGYIAGISYTGGITGTNYGDIINCNVNAGYIFSDSYLGGIAGINYGNIYGCSVKAILGSYKTTICANYLGGIVGSDNVSELYPESSLKNCSFEGSIGFIKYPGSIDNKYNLYIGGIAGAFANTEKNENYSIFLENCYSKSNLNGNDYLGGILGYKSENFKKIYISDSYYAGDIISLKENKNPVFPGNDININSVYYDKDKLTHFSLPPENTFYNCGKTTSEMFQKLTYSGWDFENIWNIAEGNDYPYLK